MILLPILCQSLVMNGVLCQKVHTVAWDLPFHLKKKNHYFHNLVNYIQFQL